MQNSGIVYVFSLIDDVWIETGKVEASDKSRSEEFGRTLVLGNAHSAILSESQLYIFEKMGTTLIEATNSVEPVDPVSVYRNSMDIDGSSLILGNGFYYGLDIYGRIARGQGAVFLYELNTGGADSDGDGIPDSFEIRHGYDHTKHTAFETLDSDGDGDLDLLEIFQGTDAHSQNEKGQAFLVEIEEGEALRVLFQRALNTDDLIATYQWSTNLADWHVAGVGVEGDVVSGAMGAVIRFSEKVLETHVDYEIVEVTVSLVAGSSDGLFFRIKVAPK